MIEREMREVLAAAILKHDPPPAGHECGASGFLLSQEPLNEFYTAVIAAMSHAYAAGHNAGMSVMARH
jgi:hypothetical protein